MTEKNRFNYYIILIFLISISFRLINIENFGLWQDELHTFFNADPSVNFLETFERLKGLNGTYHREDNTILYFYILKYFLLLTDYNPLFAKLFNIIIGSTIPLLIYLICKIHVSEKIATICALFVGINIFLIHQSQELRPSIFVVFVSLISILFFLKNYNKIYSIKKSSLCILLNTLMLSAHPFTSFILVGKSLYILSIEKISKKFIFFNLFCLLSLLFFFILNYDYILERIAISPADQANSYAQLELKFFINFFFRTFFGTITFGALNLLIILYLIFNLKFKIYENKFLRFVSLQIFSIYFCLLFFTLFITPVIAPRYILFVLPLILIWIVCSINLKSKKNIPYYVLFLITIINTFTVLENPYIPRPNTNLALNFIINNKKVFNVYSNNGILKDNYIKHHRQFKNGRLKYIDINKIDIVDKVWIICQNQPRSIVRKFNPDLDKCSLNNPNFKYNETKKFNPDYILKLYEKN
jgi:hypothetical protein